MARYRCYLHFKISMNASANITVPMAVPVNRKATVMIVRKGNRLIWIKFTVWLDEQILLKDDKFLASL